MILLIDNYDSFVYNLARHFERLGQETKVVRNDAVDADAVRALRPAAIVLSPGPCAPNDAGHSLEIVSTLHNEFPVLGVCLGHQVIAQALGGRVEGAREPMHGRTSTITHTGRGIFEGLPSPQRVCRYHSLVVAPQSLPASLVPTAWSDDGTVMALEHVELPVYGVQFHPEAILTEGGYRLLINFLRLAGREVAADAEQLASSELAIAAPFETIPSGPVTF